MAPKGECPVFRPTMSDMKDSFERYIESIEDAVSKVGACRIAPPAAWRARKAGYDDLPRGLHIAKPIKQHATGRKGLFRTLLLEHKPMGVESEFRAMASKAENLPTQKVLDAGIDELERDFWKKVTYTPPLYGADVAGSLFDKDVHAWNVAKLDTVLSRTLKANDVTLPGVNAPYLYFGMWRALFAWHTEDMDLYSVNYLHCGAPKVWYVIPPDQRKRFELVAQSLCPELHRECPEFLRHKEILISPALLQQHNIQYYRMVQQPGDFVITYPGAYHAGFNLGFNIAESTNFATGRWIRIGAAAKACECRDDSVRIDMRLFGMEPCKSVSTYAPTRRQCLEDKRRHANALEAATEAKRRREEKAMSSVAKRRRAPDSDSDESGSDDESDSEEEDEDEEEEPPLPKGWERRVRKTGRDAGATHYRSPCGTWLKSRADLRRFLGTEKAYHHLTLTDFPVASSKPAAASRPASKPSPPKPTPKQQQSKPAPTPRAAAAKGKKPEKLATPADAAPGTSAAAKQGTLCPPPAKRRKGASPPAVEDDDSIPAHVPLIAIPRGFMPLGPVPVPLAALPVQQVATPAASPAAGIDPTQFAQWERTGVLATAVTTVVQKNRVQADKSKLGIVKQVEKALGVAGGGLKSFAERIRRAATQARRESRATDPTPPPQPQQQVPPAVPFVIV